MEPNGPGPHDQSIGLKQLRQPTRSRRKSTIDTNMAPPHRPTHNLCPNYLNNLFITNTSKLLPLPLLLMVLLLVPTVPCVAANKPPTFKKDMNMITVMENTRIGDEIYTLEAVDPEGSKVYYGIEGTNLFGVDRVTGRVKVINNIDFESTGPSVRLVVTATDVPTQKQQDPATVKMSIDVNILDENDNAPKISQIRLKENGPLVDSGLLQQKKKLTINIDENTLPETMLIEQIIAIDPDTVGETPLTPICLACDPEFELVKPSGERVSSHKTIFALRTRSQISYTPKQNVRHLAMIVTDGKHNATLNTEIIISNIQNKPPVFIGSTTAVVAENVPIDTTILTIKAMDGDAIGYLPHQIDTDHQRQVVYRLIESSQLNPTKYFRLDPITGELQVSNRLDREEFLDTSGIITFTVQAIEMATMSKKFDKTDPASFFTDLDDSPNGFSEDTIRVILTDINDNSPQWLNRSDMVVGSKGGLDWPESLVLNQNRHSFGDTGRMYDVNLEENSPPGTPLDLMDMFVQDIDSGNNSTFKIELLDPSGKFDVEPRFAQGFTSVSLRVNSSRESTPLDYENPNERKFVLQVVATETSTKESFSSTATVRVNVMNVNDNAPKFKEQYYRANVREDALPGRSVISIQATDKDMSPITYSLIGQSANLFDIHPSTGLVTVAKCEPSLTNPCIDYETKTEHYILVQANDGQLSAVVLLIIHVEDASDNPPVMLRQIFETIIEEGSERFEPPLKVEAQDDDLSSVIVYSIIEGNFEGLFVINNATGEIQLTRKIKLGQKGENKLKMIVQATDGIFYSNATVLIDVLDSNDNAPVFLKRQYSIEIPENIQQKKELIRLSAQDADTGLNAQLSYKIQRGSFGMFGVDENRGVLFVGDEAKFDTAKKSEYNLEVIAVDHGLTSKTGTATVHVKVVDVNDKPPQFTPAIQTVEVPENVPIHTIIHRLQAIDPDLEQQARLRFTPEAIEALDKNGNEVRDPQILTTIIGLDTYTGEVFVNGKLDHDQLAYINLTVGVAESTLANNQSADDEQPEIGQKSYGYLLISIKDYNDNPPTFATPWSTLKPELHFTMEEERPIGSMLGQLVASDIDSKISYFKIDPPNEYFELSSAQSGIIVNKRMIDYEKLMMPMANNQDGNFTKLPGNIIQFSVLVYDSGVPLLSAQAQVYVEILPINDWDCKFKKSLYTATIKENSPEGTFVVQTEAHDNDYGPHGQLTYRLYGEYSDIFEINPQSGSVSLSSKGSMNLDRERMQSTSITAHVIAIDHQNSIIEDSGFNPHESRTCSVPIKVTIEDINDNPPQFSQKIYEVVAYEGDFPMLPIVKLSIKDMDTEYSSRLSSKNAQNLYKIISGNTNELFNISDNGLIYTMKSLNSTTIKKDEYHLKVEVRQQQTTSIFSDECEVKIKVMHMNRYSPEFLFNRIAYVNESAPPDEWVTQIRCIDKDNDSDSHSYGDDDLNQANASASHIKLRYSFKVNGLDVQETDEFAIDPRSGNITTKVSLDRESRPHYSLILVCNDNGYPQSLETLLPLTIYVVDIDDNKPEFVLTNYQRQQNRLRQVQPKTTVGSNQMKTTNNNNGPLTVEFQVDEKQGRNMVVGEIKAIDADENSRAINYCIIDGNEYQEFQLDRITGILYANQTLDREKQSSYNLVVKAINDGLSCEQHISNLMKSSTPKSSFSGTLPSSSPSHHSNQRASLSGFQSSSMKLDNSIMIIKIHVNDVNDNKPIFKRHIYRAGVKHRALVNTTITQVPAYDPDNGINATVSYTISEVLLYKRQNQAQDSNNNDMLSLQGMMSMQQKPIRLVQNPFRIDQNSYVYTTQLLTQYPLTSMFLISVEAHERVNPWRIATTKLAIWTFDTYNQVRVKVNMSPRTIESYKEEIETLMSNMTKYSAIINDIKSYYDTNQWIAATNENTMAANKRAGHGMVTVSPNNNNNDHHYKLSSSDNAYAHLLSDSDMNSDEATTSNLYLIFVDDNNKLINPQTVIEKFDLSSAHLLLPHDNQNIKDGTDRGPLFNIPIPEPFIDKIDLASVQLETMQQNSILSGDMLDLATMLIIVIGFLTIVGFIMTCIGCFCMKNWYRNHLLRQATKKLIKQHAVQARINEQMMTAAAMVQQQQQDIMSASSANMASLDAINCTNNNNDNVSIMRAAINQANNNSNLQGIVNYGANLYDNTATINNNGSNNGVATMRGGLSSAQRRQQFPNDDPMIQQQKNVWRDDESMEDTKKKLNH